MKLSIVDRIIIMQSLLPETGTIEAIKTIISIRGKLALSETERAICSISKPYNNIIEINEVTEDMVKREIEYPLTENEQVFLKNVADNCSKNGWVTISSLDTVEMLTNCNTK